jgi:hypothetical protein
MISRSTGPWNRQSTPPSIHHDHCDRASDWPVGRLEHRHEPIRHTTHPNTPPSSVNHPTQPIDHPPTHPIDRPPHPSWLDARHSDGTHTHHHPHLFLVPLLLPPPLLHPLLLALLASGIGAPCRPRLLLVLVAAAAAAVAAAGRHACLSIEIKGREERCWWWVNDVRYQYDPCSSQAKSVDLEISSLLD